MEIFDTILYSIYMLIKIKWIRYLKTMELDHEPVDFL